MKLMIVESPNKISKIKSILGSGWRVAASVGHIRDLPEAGDIGVSAPQFIPQYELTERGRDVVADLRKLVSEAEEVYLATDPDREGEAIAWHLRECLKLKKYRRVTFDAITEDVIRKSLAEAREIDEKLVRAQEARRVLDRLVGYLVSPILSDQTGLRGLSAGRVQSPAVRLVVERERAIEKFKETKHFGAAVWFDNGAWRAVWQTAPHLEDGSEYILDEALAVRASRAREFRVAAAKRKPAREAPPAPFTTSTLLQAASVSLNFNPDKAQQLAQKLFEGGHITYHRTDSQNFSDEALGEIREFIGENGWPVAPEPRRWKSKEAAQEAHEAIRPTHLEVRSAGASMEEQALYDLIWRRAVASQMADAEYQVTTLELETEVGERFRFLAVGRERVVAGWRSLTDGDATEDAKSEEDDDAIASGPVPLLREGDQARAERGEVLYKKTTPPARYTEASLIKKLESIGVGRPSTYAAILKNVIDSKGYIERRKKLLMPTERGKLVVDGMTGHFAFMEYRFTRELEGELDGIAEGKATYLGVVKKAYDNLVEDISDLDLEPVKPEFPCPACGKALNRIKGKNGFFWGCSGYRDGCDVALPDERGKPGKRAEARVSDHPCPLCGKPLLHRQKAGKGGYDFWGCSGFKDGCKVAFENKAGKPDLEKNKKP